MTVTIARPRGKQTAPCECGCGDEPRRGRFMPGHDARHLWRLVEKALHGTSEQQEEALAELGERNWKKFLALKG